MNKELEETANAFIKLMNMVKEDDKNNGITFTNKTQEEWDLYYMRVIADRLKTMNIL